MADGEYTSAELLAVEFVRVTTALTDLLGVPPDTRCATRLPKDPTFPFLAVFEVDGGPLSLDAEITRSLMQWDSYAGRGAAAPDYAAAENVALALMKAALLLRGLTVAGVGVIQSIGFRTKRRVEEPETGWARFMIETTMTHRPIGG